MMPAPLSDAFMLQGEACAALGSAFMGQLCRLLGTSDWPETPLRTRYFAWKGTLAPAHNRYRPDWRVACMRL